jgi:hypothetical protein
MFFRPLAPGFIRPRVGVAATIALIATLLGTLYLGILPNRLIRSMETRSGGAQATQATQVGQTQMLNK